MKVAHAASLLTAHYLVSVTYHLVSVTHHLVSVTHQHLQQDVAVATGRQQLSVQAEVPSRPVHMNLFERAFG